MSKMKSSLSLLMVLAFIVAMFYLPATFTKQDVTYAETTEIQEISINSPMGNSIYKKKVGDRCSYSVNDRQFTVLIKEKLDLSKQQDGSAKKLTK